MSELDNMSKLEALQLSHTYFEEMSDGYLCLKDRFGHISNGAIVSNTMLNHYLATVPNSGRVHIEPFVEAGEDE